MNKKLLLILILFTICACNKKSETRSGDYEDYPEDNYLENYIEGSKDKARDVKNQLEGIEGQRQEQMDNLFGE